MTDKIVLKLSKDGTVHGLYNEVVDFRSLGHVNTRRISNVEWSDEKQEWEVLLADGTVLGYYKDRSEAIRQEITYLNERIRKGTVEDIFK